MYEGDIKNSKNENYVEFGDCQLDASSSSCDRVEDESDVANGTVIVEPRFKYSRILNNAPMVCFSG